MLKDTTILPRITPSNVGDLECLKKFHTLRVLGEWPPRNGTNPNTAAQFGNAVHAVLKNVYDPRNGTPPNLDRLDIYVKQAFYANRYDNPTQRQEDMVRCSQVVKHYVKNDDLEDAIDTIDVEHFGEFVIDHDGKPLFRVSAKLDRLIVRQSNVDQLVVRDYKLGKPSIDLKQAFVTLFVAKLEYPQFKSYSLEYDWIGADGEVSRDVINTYVVNGQYSLLVRQILRVLETEKYLAEPGDVCNYCPLQPDCMPDLHVEINPDDPFGFCEEEVR